MNITGSITDHFNISSFCYN